MDAEGTRQDERHQRQGHDEAEQCARRNGTPRHVRADAIERDAHHRAPDDCNTEASQETIRPRPDRLHEERMENKEQCHAHETRDHPTEGSLPDGRGSKRGANHGNRSGRIAL